MAINKVVYGNQTLVDMTDATAGAEDITAGKTAYGKTGARLTGTRETGGVIRAVYTEDITSGTQYTKQITGYDAGKSLIDAFLNGLRLLESEYTVTAAGIFTLTSTIMESGNIIQIVHWEQRNGEYIAQDVGSASVTFAQATSRNNITSGETVSTIFGKIRKWFADLKTVAFTGSYSDLSNKPSLATVATSGNYNDLSNKPSLATVATSGSYNDLTNKPTIPPAVSVKGNAESSYRTGQVNLTPANIGAAADWAYKTSISDTGTYTIPVGTKDLMAVVYVGGSQKTTHNINIPMPIDSKNLGKIFLTGFYYSDKYYGSVAVQISSSRVLSLYNGWSRVNYNGTMITRADMTVEIYTR